MSSLLPKARARRLGVIALLCAGAWAFASYGLDGAMTALRHQLDEWIFRFIPTHSIENWGGVWFGVTDDVPELWAMMFRVLVVFVGVSALSVFGVTSIRQSRFDATGTDWLARLRHWAVAHPKILRALSYLPAVAALGVAYDVSHWYSVSELPPLALGAILPTLGIAWISRWLFRPLLEIPIAPALTSEGDVPIADGFFFPAVAVTPAATVAAASVVLLTATALTFALRQDPYREGALIGILAPLALALLGTFAFYRASRIAVGVDGVLVTGVARARFFPYTDIDDVKTSKAGEVMLMRGDRVALKLELYGEEARQRESIVARIRQRMEHAREVIGSSATQLARGADKTTLDDAAQGKTDYRAAAANRDDVWEVLEAAATAPHARIRAAEALKADCSADERVRLRAAAEECAEPTAREALLQMANEQDELAEALRTAK